MIEKIKKFIKNHLTDLGLALGSVLLTSLMHWVGIFDFLELKTYDYRFHTVRGPLTGWRASDSTIIQMGTDVVLVEVADETWRFLKDNKVPKSILKEEKNVASLIDNNMKPKETKPIRKRVIKNVKEVFNDANQTTN